MSRKRYRNTSKDRKLVGPVAKCPWCDKDPYASLRYISAKRGIYASGSRAAKRALKAGRAKIITIPVGHSTNTDLVVCAHRCHDNILSI